jgi:BolA family transcriptional regulator, general stress-responsive regulator
LLDFGHFVAHLSLIMRVAETIKSKLEAAFSPVSLVIEDESHRHAGHAGSRAEGETHFRVAIVSPVFAGLGRVERQRRVHAVLAEELKARVHALSLRLSTPDEASRG